MGTDRDGVLVDIGAKSEGLIPPQEMHCLRPEGPSRLKLGDEVLVFVVQPESSEGQIILSLDKARGERGWRVLQDYFDQEKAFEAYVTGYNKGGLLVNVEGVNAFVPLSQITGRPERGPAEATEKALAEWVGKSLLVKVIELNRRRNRAILSERAALQERRAQEKDRLLQELREGDLRQGRITSIRDFGIFVDIGGADGLVHLSELSWERTPKSPQELFQAGDEVEVYIMKVDHENKKIALSLRRAQPEQWEEIVANYREGQIVVGQVTKLAPFGAFVRLEGPIEGLIHISEMVDRRVQHPREVLNEDDIVPVKIVRIEHDRHRLGLSLRQARDKMEEEGWVFNDSGGVQEVPEEVRAAFAAAEAAEVGEGTAVAVEEPAAEAEAVATEEAPAEVEEPATEVEAEAAEEAVAVEEPAAEAAAVTTEEAPAEAGEPAAEVEAEASEETVAVEEPAAEAEAVATEEAAAEVEAEAVEEAVAVEEPVAEAEAEVSPEAETAILEEEDASGDDDDVTKVAAGALNTLQGDEEDTAALATEEGSDESGVESEEGSG